MTCSMVNNLNTFQSVEKNMSFISDSMYKHQILYNTIQQSVQWSWWCIKPNQLNITQNKLKKRVHSPTITNLHRHGLPWTGLITTVGTGTLLHYVTIAPFCFFLHTAQLNVLQSNFTERAHYIYLPLYFCNMYMYVDVIYLCAYVCVCV